jgi:hypothetical protein
VSAQATPLNATNAVSIAPTNSAVLLNPPTLLYGGAGAKGKAPALGVYVHLHDKPRRSQGGYSAVTFALQLG